MVVSVVFRDNPKKYDYLTDIELRKGELAVVPVGPPDAGAFEVVTVAAVKEFSIKATAWVVQRVDVKGWRQRMKKREQKEQEDDLDYMLGLEHEAEQEMIDARRDW